MSLRIVQPIEQSWTIEEIVERRTPQGWERAFKELKNEEDPTSPMVVSQEIKDISQVLAEDEKKYGMWFPLKKNLFRALDITPLSEVRVVIIGQDPYHQMSRITGEPVAQGLSFSVSPLDEIPSSLKNIHTELKSCIPGWVAPTDGNLIKWARQGVLLLNTCLTVRANDAGSHKQIWLPITRNIIVEISGARPRAIYCLWGRESQKMKKYLGDQAIVLEAAHPSGFSARRGFFGCAHFKQINDLLIAMGEEPIDW